LSKNDECKLEFLPSTITDLMYPLIKPRAKIQYLLMQVLPAQQQSNNK